MQKAEKPSMIEKPFATVDSSVAVPLHLVTELRSQPPRNNLAKQSSATGVRLPSIEKEKKQLSFRRKSTPTPQNLSKVESGFGMHHTGDPYTGLFSCDTDAMTTGNSGNSLCSDEDEATVILQAPSKPNTAPPEKRARSRGRQLRGTKNALEISIGTSEPTTPCLDFTPWSARSTRAPTSTSHLSEVSSALLSTPTHDFDDSMSSVSETLTEFQRPKHEKVGQVALANGSFTKCERSKHQKSFHWKLGAQIGCGTQGTVYRAINLESGTVFAAKEAFVADKEKEQANDVLHELEICKGLSHPHIVTFLGHEYAGNQLYIFMEFIAGGSMTKMLNEFGALSEPLLKRSTCGLLEGLDYLHTRDPPIVHRDIKGGNILVDMNFHVKLADFGCSKQAAMTTSFSTMGSVPWMAPEVIRGQEGYGRKADVWSLGCAIIEMATAERPWGNRAFDNILYAMRYIGFSEVIPPIPETTSALAQDLICNCVRRNAEDRMSAAELLRHEFVQDHRSSCGSEV